MYGNAPLSKTTRNAQSILQAIGRTDVPVHPGVSKPFSREIEHAPDIHGESGLDGTDLLPQPDRRPLTHCNAIKDMRDALLSCPPGTAWLVATGTLTNVALMFAVFPEVSPSLCIQSNATIAQNIENAFSEGQYSQFSRNHSEVLYSVN